MANKLIEELIIKVKQQGAKPTEKALQGVAEALGDASNNADAFISSWSKIPAQLQNIGKVADDTANRIRDLNSSLTSSASTKSLDSIEQSLSALLDESIDTNETLVKLNNNLVHSFDNLSNALGSDLERIQDGLIDVERGARKTGDALGNIEAGASRAGRGLAAQNRQGRGATRTFADLARIAGPLPLIYANVAANIFAVSEGFRLLTSAEQITRLEELGATIGAQIGVPLQSLAKSLVEVSGGVLSYSESLRQASSAAGFGFTESQISSLAQVARRASVAYGQDFTDALNRAIRGVSKLEVELLDELGVATKLTTAYEKYAATINSTADDLTSYQQRLALLNEVTQQSGDKLGYLDSKLRSLPWERAATNAENAWNRVSQSIASSTSFIAEAINNALDTTKVEDFRAKAEALSEQLTAAQMANSREGVIGAFTGYQELEVAARAYLKTQENILMNNTADSQAAREAINTRQQIFAILKGINNLRNANFLGVQDAQAASAVYADFRGSVKGTVTEVTNLVSGLSEATTPADNLVKATQSLVDSYKNLTTLDPYADKSKALAELGVRTEKELYNQNRLAKAYQNATKDYRATATVNAKGLYETAVSGGSIEKARSVNLSTQLTYLQAQRDAMAPLVKGTAALAKQDAEIYGLKYQILQANIELNNTNHDRINSQIESSSLERTELGTKMLILDNERQRLANAVKLNAPLEERLSITEKINRLEKDTQSVQRQLSTEMFSGAMSNLASYGQGIDTLTNSIQQLSSTLYLDKNGSLATSLQGIDGALVGTAVGLQAFQGYMQYASANAISAVDAQINAERKRDGKSKESLAKIRELEAKKIRMQQEAAKKQILISTAVAVMNAAANPWPLPAIPLMAAAALAGGLAYSQASSAASNQMANLGGGGADKTASLSVGSRDNRVDVSSQATRGELSYIRGEQGTGTIGSFTPRAAGGIGTPGLSFLAGENGPELVTPTEQVQVSDASDTANMLSNTRSGSFIENFNIQAMDAQSIIDRAPEIYEAFAREAEQRGQDVNKLG